MPAQSESKQGEPFLQGHQYREWQYSGSTTAITENPAEPNANVTIPTQQDCQIIKSQILAKCVGFCKLLARMGNVNTKGGDPLLKLTTMFPRL